MPVAIRQGSIGLPLRAALLAAGAAAVLLASPLKADSAGQESVDAAAPGENAQPADSVAPQVIPAAAPSPVKAKFLFSQFADIPVSGSADSVLRYGGKLDGYFDVKGSAFGADDSISVHLHPEFKYGESANGRIGLIPTNTLLFYPGDGEVFDFSVNVTKRWKSGTSLTLGKVNVLDLSAQLPVEGGGAHGGFQNLSMALPPSAIVPGSITGALLTVPTRKALYRLWVFDADTQSKRTGFETAFENGVAFLGSVTVPVKIGGKQGYYALKLTGSTRSNIAADSIPAVLIPAPGSGFGNRRGEFSAVLAGYQYIEQYVESPGKGWGIFGQVYISNGDPTFLDKSGFIGVSGNPRGRPQDRFGLAWFRYSLTDSLVEALTARVALEDEEGVEAFYTLGLHRNLAVTADLQLIDSAVEVRETGVIAGLRLTAEF